MRWVTALVGAVVGYFVVVYPSCTWFWPQSNLCGISFPVGILAGGLLGYWLVARRRQEIGIHFKK
jgi:hypothetical protein